ncbi:MAG: rod shape-determining protein [Cellvibrionaceae bacterium]|nr:rod shape-determining protein [Cellvibrionaceae bacterium]
MINSFFSNDLYVRIWADRLSVVCLASDGQYDDEPYMALEGDSKGRPIVKAIGQSAKHMTVKNGCKVLNPFSHPRTLIGDFLIAEKILQHAFREVHKNKLFAPSPRVIVQPMEKIEGGLSAVEERAFRELCLGAGAREVYIHIGQELSTHGLSFQALKNKNN